MEFLWGLFLSAVVFLVLKIILERDAMPVHGIYKLPGKWYLIKKILTYFRLQLKRRRRAKLLKEENNGTGSWVKPSSFYEGVEQPQPLRAEKAIDGVSFYGTSSQDETHCSIVLNRRTDRRAELSIFLYLPEMGYLQSPLIPDSIVYNTSGRGFEAGGLTVWCLQPMSRWKVTYNGLLKKAQGDDDYIHVKFSFIWESCGDVMDFDYDLDPWLVADSIARETWNDAFWNSMESDHIRHFEQWGEMRGEIAVGDNTPTRVFLTARRTHCYGVWDWGKVYREANHFGCLEDGTTFGISVSSYPGILSYSMKGYLGLGSGYNMPITDMDFDIASLHHSSHAKKTYNIKFYAGGVQYSLDLKRYDEVLEEFRQADRAALIVSSKCQFTLNGIKGVGFVTYTFRNENKFSLRKQASVKQLMEHSIEREVDANDLVLPFESRACTSSALVGGKGCQLALLTEFNSSNFQISKGVCLTITAFKKQLKENTDLSHAISKIQEVCSGLDEDLNQTCEKIVQLFHEIELNEEIHHALQKAMEQFPQDTAFAVRSSASGEDGQELSGAGQLETFLGVKGIEEIVSSVKKCWASHFTYQAVEYRRQNGQPIISNMAVVIQKMVPAKAAGVMFTLNPLSGHPGEIVINCNYGLGESVVSGKSEPDQIILRRTTNDSDAIKIIETIIGKKAILMKQTDAGGIHEESVSEENSSECCISEKIALKLADIGIQIEQAFGDARDIEWAITEDDDIYILQARPITTLQNESDWEILHEFDSPVISNKEVFTTGNIGEMMPGAVCPLTHSTFLHSLDYAFSTVLGEANVLGPKDPKSCLVKTFANTAFLNLMFTRGLCETNVLGGDHRAGDLALLGEVLKQITVEDVTRYWGKNSIWRRIYSAYRAYKSYNTCKEDLLGLEYLLRMLNLTESPDAASVYDAINSNLHHFFNMWKMSLKFSTNSGIMSQVLMNILSNGKMEWTTDHYSDMALLLSKCEGVYSADVPISLQELADEIRESGMMERILEMDVKEATGYLLSSQSYPLNKAFARFLKAHGHRCVREAELLEKSWQTEPWKVVQVIQKMLRAASSRSSKKRKQFSIDEAVEEVNSPLSTFGRLILPWVTDRARKGVGQREWGKSLAVFATETFKKAYWDLASKMKREGYLPDDELLFYLTHREIGQLIKNRSAKLVLKAKRRKRLHAEQMSYSYPRLNSSRPQAIQVPTTNAFVTTQLHLQGMPVSQGSIRGTARVVLSLEEAQSIKPGEILIVQYTDVGWSPYFPLISGLVTEVGGLVSHGAVVAREYGLPCIVNVPKATQLISTGDKVILNGSSGVLEKLSCTEEGAEE